MADDCNSKPTVGLDRQDQLRQLSSSDHKDGVVQETFDLDQTDAVLQKADSENFEVEENRDEQDKNAFFDVVSQEAGASSNCFDSAVLEKSEERGFEGEERDDAVWGRKGELLLHDDVVKPEAEGEEKVEIAEAATSCFDDAVLEKSEERGFEEEMRDGTVLVGNEKVVLHDVLRQEAEGEEKVEIAGATTSCFDDAVSEKREERGSEAETRNGTVLEGKGEHCVEEAMGAYATGLNDGVCKNQESKPVDCETDDSVLEKGEMGVSGIQEILKIDGKLNEKNCCMKIEVVDETALVGFGKERKATNFSENSRKNVNHKRPRRRGKSGADDNQKFVDMGLAQNCGTRKNEKGGKRVYTRTELEVLRFVAVDWQRKKWTEVYCGLGPAVQEEYDGLVGSDNHSQFHHQQLQQQKKKHTRVDFNPRFRNEARSSVFALSGEEYSENAENENAYENLIDPPGLHVIEQDECLEDDSDEDYSSIQKPAFFVTGEPDFDSGPPEDGLEYLRRVRWESAQIPKVKVAKVDRTKLNKEQTVYMPLIPDIAKCPVHLMPLKEWEDAFLADFSELRLALSRLENMEAKVQSSSTVHEGQSSSRPFDSFLLENIDNMPFVEDSSQSVQCCTPETCGNPCSSVVANDNDGMDSVASPSSRSHISGVSEKCPTLSMILRMDSVARVSMLRKRINVAESMSSISWDDCLWLFALSAAVDCPLDADTSAAFRSLLRKCASVRAEKLELDDEVAMLNILVTISGRYFGQLQN
ncbi:uncharacterized protein LOC113776152 isoform X1 [Coffea eugenioides]|uniref:uncharacterized protein LOC113776152 isoform X1 n=1 Tax=Coffea eugenioides TaxID=49369 RepID=UPI000F6145D2|nr:uncharacterized protein LOC113776152 isoform X1 [Coffea eugenioides]